MADTYRKGAKVTVAKMQFHGVIVDSHTSHVVRRADGSGGFVNVVVGDDEVQPADEVLDTATSYLVHRHWDATDVWLEEQMLASGHDLTVMTESLKPSAAVMPAGARQ